jgi:hypothetical protein
MSDSTDEAGWPCWYGTDATGEKILLVNMDDGTHFVPLYRNQSEADGVIANIPGYCTAKIATLAELVAFLELVKKLKIGNVGFVKDGKSLPRTVRSVLLDATIALEEQGET